MRKVFIGMLTIIVLVVSLGTASAQTYLSLDVPRFVGKDQEKSNWCWAAGAQMLLGSQGINVSQGALVKMIYGPTEPNLPTFGRLDPIKASMDGRWPLSDGRTAIVNTAYNYGPPTDPAGMITAIKGRRPFLVAWNGHAYVCYGITWHEQPFLRVVELRLFDPLNLPGRLRWTTFSVFRDDIRKINGTLAILPVRFFREGVR